ncbi:immunity 53 family protein [Streptomyces longhuiensis]|uniref:immunity 53 family protein n=1 Tax=Streptomyces longhuiensis TaxID=2880933 RepID=UPI0022218B99|nr:immunity 53 family protein [Streptomyces longhuiensis]
MAIETLDNPGWSVKIDLAETDLADREYPRQQVMRSAHDWVMAWTSEKAFHAACGPGQLTEDLTLFSAGATVSAVTEESITP